VALVSTTGFKQGFPVAQQDALEDQLLPHIPMTPTQQRKLMLSICYSPLLGSLRPAPETNAD
jgi:hypothetical protein